MLTSPDGLFVVIALLSGVILSLIFINEAKNVGEGSCVAEQMRRVSLAAEPLLSLLLQDAAMLGLDEALDEDMETLPPSQFPSVHASLETLERTTYGADIQVSLVSQTGQILADSDRKNAGLPAQRPLPLRISSSELSSIAEAVHKGKVFADKVGHQMLLVKAVTHFPSLILVLRAEG